MGCHIVHWYTEELHPWRIIHHESHWDHICQPSYSCCTLLPPPLVPTTHQYTLRPAPTDPRHPSHGGGGMTFPLDGVANDIVKIIVRQWSDAFPIYLQDHITIFTKYISTAIFYMSRETTAHTIDRYHLYYISLNHTNVVPPYLSLQRLLHQDWSLTMYVPVYGDINNPPTWQM